jgi:hypothetical protein
MKGFLYCSVICELLQKNNEKLCKIYLPPICLLSKNIFLFSSYYY